MTSLFSFFRSLIARLTYRRLVLQTAKIPKHSQRGFSLIELLVTLSIFAIITTVVLAKNNQFNTTFGLNNLAYDVALSIRQAQVYGLGVRGASGNFDAGYGVHFDASNLNAFIFFVDLNNNGRYDTSGASESLNVYTIGNGNSIMRLCVTTAGGQKKCNDDSSLSRLDILFERPDLDARIRTNVLSDEYQSATISLVSPQKRIRTISIFSTGQISVMPNDN